MKPLLLQPYFIFILLLIISTHTPTCLCEDYVQYTNCSYGFSCGNSNIPNLKYPFWGGNRENYCGVSELEKLTCEDNVPKININSIKYRILGWSDTTQIFTVARDDYWSQNSVCVPDPKNNSFDNTPFRVDDGLVNITFFYDCPMNSSPNIPIIPQTDLFNITCDGKHVYYTDLDVPSSYAGPCTVVVIPIFQNKKNSVESDSEISDALNGGFEMKWTGNYEECKTCTDSGGECGSTNGRFQCFCKDGPSDATCKDKSNGQLRTMVLIIVPTIVSVILFLFCYYLIKRKSRKSIKSLLRENFGNESDTLEHLQFNLATLKAATNNFSNENRVGKGGFGEVYKGILVDGRHIAVKRLSKCSTQGVDEFKNEVMVIAKLQHRNLVTLIGFCLEEENKILIYEYVSNNSLDYFLFDSQQSKFLSWFERYNIIRGIAGGILYLHDHSRLKVIHRDLKPSNVLLDENMTPKISDFGLAKIVEINQDQNGTNRIAGTFGYMPPEYAMLGQYSEKSDVFSFGVMVLEIITGKKNLSSYEPHRIADGLLNFVWRQWRDQMLLSILDPSIKENCPEIEVIKCIQIGLLCVQQNPTARPMMSTVVSYFNSHLSELPTPEEPAFFVHGKMDPIIFAEESSADKLINRPIPFSVNQISVSDFFPR